MDMLQQKLLARQWHGTYLQFKIFLLNHDTSREGNVSIYLWFAVLHPEEIGMGKDVQ